MPRDDSILNTGMTSASMARKPTPRETQAKQKEEDYAKLKPAAEVVLEAIAQEVQKITDIRSLIIDRTNTEKEVNTELIARKLYLNYLNSLEAKIKGIVTLRAARKHKPESEAAGE